MMDLIYELLIKRRLLRTLCLALVLSLALSNVAFAAGNIFFNKPGTLARTNILDEKGVAIPSSNLEFGSDQVEFFYGTSLGSNPKSVSNVPADKLYGDSTFLRRYNFKDDGHDLQVRVWSGTPHEKGAYFGYTSKSYDGRTSYDEYTDAQLKAEDEDLTDGTSSTPSYLVIKSFKTSYKYDNPYQPGIGTPRESYVRIPGTTDVELELVVPATYNSTQNGITIPATKYTWRVWDFYENDEAKAMEFANAGVSLTLTTKEVQPGGKYFFKVKAFNWFDDGGPWSDPYPYELLPFGDPTKKGAEYRTVIELKKKTGDFGVNSFAIPFPGPHYDAAGNPMTINTAKGLIDTINRIAGENVVSAFGFWDPANQMISGYVFKADGTVEKRPATLAEPENLALVSGRGYQISVSKDVNFEIRNYIEGAADQ